MHYIIATQNPLPSDMLIDFTWTHTTCAYC